jgi:hypothetical protein
MSEGRLTLAGTDDYYSAIVRQAALEDNTGLLLALTLSVAAPTSDPSWCEIGVSGEIDQVTAYLLLCENPFRAMAGEFRAGIFEDAIALSADPAPRFVRASDEAYGLFIARGRQNQVALVLWPLAAPEARTIFSIEDPPYAPNYVFAKPYPGVALTLRDVVAVKFEALK